MIIREYRDTDNLQWVRCRVLSFLDSAYFDNVLREKERYENPSIELVAEDDGRIVGLIDLEYEKEKGTVCSNRNGLGGMIWHLAVLPEYRGKGIAAMLLDKVKEKAREAGIERLEAWTRDDKWVNEWYKKRGFKWIESYLHVYAEGNECDIITDSKIEKLHICSCFSHYVGEDKDEIKRRFKRVHECNLYELVL